MLCGENSKTGRCLRVYSQTDISSKCEISENKRCKKKSVKLVHTPKPKTTKPKTTKPKTTKPKTPKSKTPKSKTPIKKTCEPGKVLNLKTNRCNKSKAVKTQKQCGPGKVLNRKTNRCNKRKLNPKPKAKPEPKYVPSGPAPGHESSSPEIEEVNYKCKIGDIYNHKTNKCVTKSGPLGKKIMMTSITNTIGGPVSLDYYKFKFGGVMRHFLLFGDEHTQYKAHKSPEIIEISTLIKKIIRKSPYCIDLFSENPIIHDRAKGKALQKYSDPLSAIRNEFKGCPYHHIPGLMCDYDNLRYQNWDLRFIGDKKASKFLANPYDEVMMKYPITVTNIEKKFAKKNIIKYILGFTEDMKMSTEKKIDAFFLELFEKYNKRDSFAIKVAEKNVLRQRRAIIQKEYKKCMKSVNFPKNLLDTFIKNFIALNDTDYTLVFTDFYILCRMFLNFDTNKKTPKRCPVKGKNNYKTPQYSILYAGHAHSESVATFFGRMFNVKPVYTTRIGFPNGKHNKLIKVNDIRDNNGKKLEGIVSVDELFTDFY